MSRDFEIVQSRRNIPTVDQGDITVLPSSKDNSRIGDAIADNFGQILDLASNIIEIEKMKVQSDAVLKQMEESRKALIDEATAYAMKTNAETDRVVKKLQIIRDMMRDFYQYNNTKISGEEFSRTISDIINNMEKL